MSARSRRCRAKFYRGDKIWKLKEIGRVLDQIAKKTVLEIHAVCVVTTLGKNASAVKIVTMPSVATWKTEQKIYKTPKKPKGGRARK